MMDPKALTSYEAVDAEIELEDELVAMVLPSIEADLRAAHGWAERDQYFDSLSEEHKVRFADLKWSLDAAEFGIAVE